jgi:hypothetical protein
VTCVPPRSNNEWSFEEAVAAHTECEIHTFDCTVTNVTIPPALANRVTFHETCLGEDR